MQEPSVFTRIIRGEIPSHKVYEDDRTIAILDIHAMQPGYTLVIPKAQVDRLENLEPADYTALMDTLKKVMRRVVEVFGPEYRACLKLYGFDVPHVHIHVIPCRGAADFAAVPQPDHQPDHEALAAIAARLKF